MIAKFLGILAKIKIYEHYNFCEFYHFKRKFIDESLKVSIKRFLDCKSSTTKNQVTWATPNHWERERESSLSEGTQEDRSTKNL